ncbi:AraC family transcriptional regulator [Nonomuraea glycinis]|uniref:AraC family transcriptional regulator n=1 Tax=Nonomuraea glycinis TaxID=2047744 RepID=UPI002E161FCC|nr:AraC family transcriptional regulator [Nonomuraea glycinis]
MYGDLLSELLAPLRLRGVFHSRWTARAPWGVAGEREHCALLHYVQEGTCVVELPDRVLPVGHSGTVPPGEVRTGSREASADGVPEEDRPAQGAPEDGRPARGAPGEVRTARGASGGGVRGASDEDRAVPCEGRAGVTRVVRLRAGDLAVFPQGAAHRIADAPGGATMPLETLLPGREPGAMRTVRIDGPGPATTMLCGGLHYDEAAASPLYRALPAMLVLGRDAVAGQPLLGDTLTRLSGEWDLGEPGLGLVAVRAFELAYVLALRAALADPEGVPVLQALRHPAISRALLAVQCRFGEPWTVESLAAESGLSRSAFAATFRELVGEAPMRHLTARRMREAARLLADTPLPHSAIAERVGYRSAVGFHLAFKQWYGHTPGDHRKDRARQAGPAHAG